MHTHTPLPCKAVEALYFGAWHCVSELMDVEGKAPDIIFIFLKTF